MKKSVSAQHLRQVENAIYSQWNTLPKTNRTGFDAEKLANETYQAGLRLAKNSNTHYQEVMALLNWPH
jgi:hypothetical protein